MSEPVDIIKVVEARSSILEKLPPNQRRNVDRALIERDPPTVNAVYEKFHLDRLGISKPAFYRYARRLRVHAMFLETAEMTLPDEPNMADLLPHMVARRLAEIVDDDESSPQSIQRLANTWRAVVTTARLYKRLQTAAADADSSRVDDLCRAMHDYASLMRKHTPDPA